DALKTAHVSRVFNAYDFGGYLVWRNVKTFIDGRTELYGGDFVKRDVDTVTLRDIPDLLRLLDAYDIQATLLPPALPANAFLARLSSWRRIYADDIAVVYLRSSAAPGAN